MEIIIILLGLLIDRITKLCAMGSLKDGNNIIVIKNLFQLEYLENTGAAFGIFNSRTGILSLVTSVVILALIVYLAKYRPKNLLERIGVSLIIAGAIGNLIDRVYYKYVVDFLKLHYKDVYVFPTFNVADVLISLGTAVIIIYLVKDNLSRYQDL